MKPKFLSSFLSLNIVQFLSALNDNIYKLLLVFLLINLYGDTHCNTILALAGAIFVIPFLLFASVAGGLADRFSKKRIIASTRVIEVGIMVGAVLSIYYKNAIGGYSVLFLMAVQSALFSPAKFGILPEIIKKGEISHYNGLMTATTYLAIIVGTFLASFLADVTGRNYAQASWICVAIAVLGALFSFGIQKTYSQNKEKKLSMNFLVYQTLKKTTEVPYLFQAIFFAAYFLFMGAYVQLNIIPFAINSLILSEVHGGYLFLMTAIGIGIGSFLAGRFSGHVVQLGFVPLAAFGMGVAFLSLFFFAHHFYAIVATLVFLGICGGFYIVPLDAYIQTASPAATRGENLAAANFLSFSGVVIASFLIGFLGDFLKLEAATGFLIVGVVTLLMSISLFLIMKKRVQKLFRRRK